MTISKVVREHKERRTSSAIPDRSRLTSSLVHEEKKKEGSLGRLASMRDEAEVYSVEKDRDCDLI